MESYKTAAYETFTALKNTKLTLCSAESCTGGLIVSTITSFSGASDLFDRGFVTYSNEAKHDCLGIPMQLINNHGAVSPEVAKAMAQGAFKNSAADIAISVTGIAGPNGGTENKPVGLVYIGWATKNKSGQTKHLFLDLTREEVQKKTAEQAFLKITSLTK